MFFLWLMKVRDHISLPLKDTMDILLIDVRYLIEVNILMYPCVLALNSSPRCHSVTVVIPFLVSNLSCP